MKRHQGSTQNYKVGLVTWNVAGLFPDNKTEKGLETFFTKRLKGMDFLVVFLQEIVELKVNTNTAVEMVQQAGFGVFKKTKALENPEDDEEIGLNGEPKKSTKKYKKTNAVRESVSNLSS